MSAGTRSAAGYTSPSNTAYSAGEILRCCGTGASSATYVEPTPVGQVHPRQGLRPVRVDQVHLGPATVVRPRLDPLRHPAAGVPRSEERRVPRTRRRLAGQHLHLVRGPGVRAAEAGLHRLRVAGVPELIGVRCTVFDRCPPGALVVQRELVAEFARGSVLGGVAPARDGPADLPRIEVLGVAAAQLHVAGLV